jgi:flagellar export protein FliJ
MGFQFSLATLLRLREIAEDREERHLAQILSQIARTRLSLRECQTQNMNLIRAREGQIRRQLSGAQLQITYNQLRSLELMQKEIQDQLDKLEVVRDQQMKTYEAAHRDREALSQIREKQLQHFRYEQSRREQSTMDDTFASRRIRR